MKQTFFDAIGAAGLENIHSRTLQWLLSDDGVLANSQNGDLRSQFSHCLLGLAGWNDNHALADCAIVKCVCEEKKIDILIVCKELVIAIENKVKIGEHSNQLTRYRDQLENDPKYKEKHKYYILLSLVGDEASDSDIWKSVSYASLADALEQFLQQCASHPDVNIVGHYHKTISNLSQVVDEVDRDGLTRWLYWGTEDSLTASQREVIAYIKTLKLQRKLRLFHSTKVAKMLEDKLNSGNDRYRVTTDTSGFGGFSLFQIDYQDYQFCLQNNGRSQAFKVGIQVQNTSVKINVTVPEADYAASRFLDPAYSSLWDAIRDYWSNNTVKSLLSSHNGNNDKAYYSISDPDGFVLNSDHSGQLTKSDIAKKLEDIVAIYEPYVVQLYNHIIQQGAVSPC